MQEEWQMASPNAGACENRTFSGLSTLLPLCVCVCVLFTFCAVFLAVGVALVPNDHERISVIVVALVLLLCIDVAMVVGGVFLYMRIIRALAHNGAIAQS
jgi:hypothetical protein